MQPAITLTFATRDDFEAFLARECALRMNPVIERTAEVVALTRMLSDAIQRIDLLESTAAKVVETNVSFHGRIKALEEDTLVADWSGEPVEEKQAA